MSQQSTHEWAFRISSTHEAELESFKDTVELYKFGEISEAQFRAARVPMGIYEQRESGTYMLRVRLAAGCLLPEQLRCVARVAQVHGDGTLHFSTRQDVQIHGVRLSALHPGLIALGRAGLACKGGGGNTVRNIATCCRAGVCGDELFDVSPYAIALTERLMTDSASFQLPRKYKIAFSGCPTDCASVAANDLGFIARQRDGVAGFAVYVGGGMGKMSRLGNLLHEFIPATDVYCVAEAVKRLFGRYGDRKNKNLARLRFVVRRLGFERFRELYQAELSQLQASCPAPLQVRLMSTQEARHVAPQDKREARETGEYERWRSVAVHDQKQPGFYDVEIALPLGDLGASTAHDLADVIAQHGDGLLRANQAQNLSIRWLVDEELPVLYAKLGRLGLASSEPPVLRNLVTCAGASTCRLGICRSRDLARAISDKLRACDVDLRATDRVRIHVSGCSNSCGRHLLADLGLHGVARRTQTGLVPYYAVSVGGTTLEGQSHLAEECGAVPAKNVPDVLVDVLRSWTRREALFAGSVDADGRKAVRAILTRYQEPPALEVGKTYHSDWGTDESFSLEGRGPAECGAGIFDLITLDLANAQRSLVEGDPYVATLCAARALLVTRGLQPKSEVDALRMFRRYFLEEGRVEQSFGELVDETIRSASSPNPKRNFHGPMADVSAFVAAVNQLYDNMDPSLQLDSGVAHGRLESPVASAANLQLADRGPRKPEPRHESITH